MLDKKKGFSKIKMKQVELSSAKLSSLSWVEAELEFDLFWWLKYLKTSIEVFELLFHSTTFPVGWVDLWVDGWFGGWLCYQKIRPTQPYFELSRGWAWQQIIV